MPWKIEFQYKPPSRERPLDGIQQTRLEFPTGQFFPIPAVGDTVYIDVNDQPADYKVVTRHFSYLGEWCVINIVVTDVSHGEMSARLKQ